MDLDKQAKMDSSYKNLVERPFSIGKPKYKDYFIQDLQKIIVDRETIGEAVKEAIMYSCDMCLEFDRKSFGLLTRSETQHIVSEVCDAIEELITKFDFSNEIFIEGSVTEFDMSNRVFVMDRVMVLMYSNKQELKIAVDKHYKRF